MSAENFRCTNCGHQLFTHSDTHANRTAFLDGVVAPSGHGYCTSRVHNDEGKRTPCPCQTYDSQHAALTRLTRSHLNVT